MMSGKVAALSDILANRSALPSAEGGIRAIEPFVPQRFSWLGVDIAEPMVRSRRMALGQNGWLIFKSDEDARGSKIEVLPAAAPGEEPFLELATTAQGREARLLLPLKNLVAEAAPQGSRGAFLLTFKLEGLQEAKPLEWVALLAARGSPDLRFWRKLADNLDARGSQTVSLRFSISLGGEEDIPTEVYLALQMPPKSGLLRIGEIGLERESVSTAAGGFETNSPASLGGWAQCPTSNNVWLEAVPRTGAPVRFELDGGGEVFKIIRGPKTLSFSASRDKLTSVLSSLGECSLFLGRDGATLASTEINPQPLAMPPIQGAKPAPVDERALAPVAAVAEVPMPVAAQEPAAVVEPAAAPLVPPAPAPVVAAVAAPAAIKPPVPIPSARRPAPPAISQPAASVGEQGTAPAVIPVPIPSARRPPVPTPTAAPTSSAAPRVPTPVASKAPVPVPSARPPAPGADASAAPRVPARVAKQAREAKVEQAPERGGEVAAAKPFGGPASLSAVGNALQSVDDTVLADFIQEVLTKAVNPRIQGHFKAEQWAALEPFQKMLLPDSELFEKLLLLVGRAAVQSGDPALSLRTFTAGAALFPNSDEMQYHCGFAYLQAGRAQQAVTYLRAALGLVPGIKRTQLAMAEALQLVGRNSLDSIERGRLMDEAVMFMRAAVTGGKANALIKLVRLLHNLGRDEEAVEVADQLLEATPRNVNALLIKSRSLVALNRFNEALAVATRASVVDPTNQSARFQIRALKDLADESGGDAKAPTFGDLVLSGKPWFSTGPVGEATTGHSVSSNDELAQALGGLTFDWLRVLPSPGAGTGSERWSESIDSFRGYAEYQEPGSDTFKLWRRETLVHLAESGLIANDLSNLSDFESVFGRTKGLSGDKRTVALLSRHGSNKFGGGEQFLDSMAEHYRTVGYEPIVIGVNGDVEEFVGEQNGARIAYFKPDAAVLRKFFLQAKVDLVHTISGLGSVVADALNFTNIPFIYGVHFWREVLRGDGAEADYFTTDRKPMPRPEFKLVLSRAASVYSNSQFTRDVLETSFGMRTPVVYSLPREVDPPPPAKEGMPTDYVLLVNSRAEKGFDLMLDVAALRPEINFVCIASQSNPQEAKNTVKQRGLNNVHIIRRTDEMAALYGAAKVVAVPSYKFVETFSRVCIEAQRFGKPVLGSNVGNVPLLLQNSGFVLPHDPVVWAAELGRLYGEPDYYAAACAAALRNSEAYPYSDQRRSILSIARHAHGPVLVGVGSGIGNMIHVAPMIRRIAEHLGRPVDVLSLSDHEGALFLLQNASYVNSVYPLRRFALNRRYDTVFLTHSFGAARIPIEANKVVWSRDWAHFSPDDAQHEALFNLEAAKQMLGVDYSPEDVFKYFVGDLVYRWPAGKLVGFHGGSKSGHWASKRWPHFTEFSEYLKAQGYRVASFGTADEYVPGTEDMTGGTVEQMAQKMLACSYFVSNDSGVMNLANGLGIPLVAVFAPTNVVTRGPLRSTSRSVHLIKDCSPCECKDIARFTSGGCACIAEITLREVAGVFEQLARNMEASVGGSVSAPLIINGVLA